MKSIFRSLTMEIYNSTENTNETYQANESTKNFFPRSEFNDWLPIWEKIAFFLLGFLGIKLFSYIVSLIVASAGFIVAKDGYYTYTPLGATLINFFTYLLLVLAFAGFLFFDKRKTYKRFAKEFKSVDTYIYALIGFGLVLGFQLLLGNIFANTIPFYGSNANEEGIESMTKSYPVLIFIMTVFFAPFAEELTYRIGLVDTFGHKYKLRWLGIALSALIFGLIHANIISAFQDLSSVMADEAATEAAIQKARYALYNEWLNLPIYIGSGFFLALTYAKSGKITSSMLAHFGVNLFSMVASFISNAGK